MERLTRPIKKALDPREPHVLDLPSFWFKPIDRKLETGIEALREKTGLNLERALLGIRLAFRLWNASIPIRYASPVIALTGVMISQCTPDPTHPITEESPYESPAEHEPADHEPLGQNEQLILTRPPRHSEERLRRLHEFNPREEIM